MTRAALARVHVFSLINLDARCSERTRLDACWVRFPANEHLTRKWAWWERQSYVCCLRLIFVVTLDETFQSIPSGWTQMCTPTTQQVSAATKISRIHPLGTMSISRTCPMSDIFHYSTLCLALSGGSSELLADLTNHTVHHSVFFMSTLWLKNRNLQSVRTPNGPELKGNITSFFSFSPNPAKWGN